MQIFPDGKNRVYHFFHADMPAPHETTWNEVSEKKPKRSDNLQPVSMLLRAKFSQRIQNELYAKYLQ
jgi:hypothetical protein